MNTNATWQMHGTALRWLTVGLVVSSLIFAGYLGVIGALDDTKYAFLFPVGGWVMIALGFLGLFKSVAELAVIRRPMITLSPVGIAIPREFDGVLPWRDVVEIVEFGGGHSMRIVASESFLAQQRPGPLRKMLDTFNSLVKMPGYYVTAMPGNRSHEELSTALAAYAAAHQHMTRTGRFFGAPARGFA